MRRLFAACAVAAFPLSGLAAAEDLTVVYKTSGQQGEGVSTQYYSDGRMRTSSGQTDVLYDVAAGRMVTIDHAKKEYSEMTAADVEASMAAAGAEMEKMSAQLEGMPAAVRERMQEMMGGGEVALTRGGTREIAGYTAQEYTITRGDSMRLQIWATPQIDSPVSPEDVQRMTSLGSSLAAVRGNPLVGGMAELAEKMKQIEGFPLADSNRISVMGQSMTSSREATEVRKGALPDSTFDLAVLAPGYKKVASPLARGRR